MILLALAAVAFFLFAGKSGSGTVTGAGVSGAGVTPVPTTPSTPLTSAPQTPVIRNATGGSLSAALGSNANSPGYYVSGNPGYDVQVKPVAVQRVMPRSGIPFRSTSQVLPVKPAQPPATSRGVVNVPLKTPVNPAGTLKPIIANRPVVTVRLGPEVASAPWTKLAVRS